MQKQYNCGQVVIVLVMVMAIVALVFTHIATINIASLVRARETVAGDDLATIAEGYLESGAIRFLRDVGYTGEVIEAEEYTCTITITDLGGEATDLSTSCTDGLRTKTVGMSASYSDGIYTFSPIQVQ